MSLARFLLPVAGLVLVIAIPSLPADQVPAQFVRIQKILPFQPGDPNNPTDKSPDEAQLDKKALDSANLKATDPDGLLKYLKERTLSDVELTKIQAVIKLLGSEDFDGRLKATIELEQMGPPAIAPLRLASKDGNSSAEVVYRAEYILKRIEKVSTPKSPPRPSAPWPNRKAPTSCRHSSDSCHCPTTSPLPNRYKRH